MKCPVRFALCLGCLLSFGAAAQWQWIDQGGRNVYSDIAPPSTVPEKNIVRRPAQPAPATETAPAGSLPQPSPGSPSAPGVAKPGPLDRMLSDQKLKADQAQAARRQADEAQHATLKADNCLRAKRSKTALDSVARLSPTNAQG